MTTIKHKQGSRYPIYLAHSNSAIIWLPPFVHLIRGMYTKYKHAWYCVYTWDGSRTPYFMKLSPLSVRLYSMLKLLIQVSICPSDLKNSTTIGSVKVSCTWLPSCAAPWPSAVHQGLEFVSTKPLVGLLFGSSLGVMMFSNGRIALSPRM